MLPVISQELLPGSRIPVHAEEELVCDAVGMRPIKYIWYFNNSVRYVSNIQNFLKLLILRR